MIFMKYLQIPSPLSTACILVGCISLSADSNGLAPEINNLKAEDISYALEAKLPDLEQAYISTSPKFKGDGIPVGVLGNGGGDKTTVLKYAQEIADGQRGTTDSLLIAQEGKLLFESYFRRGRSNYPHFQMSITKSYTALAIGRAMQMGYITMAELDKPILSFLKDIDREKIVPGADQITLAQAMNMRSGIRIDKVKSRELMRQRGQLKGQKQIEAYLTHSASIASTPRDYKYQGADPAITMQVLEAIVPGSAEDFIKEQLLAPLGVSNYSWQTDVSGLPKAGAGSSFTSRDMLKLGSLILNEGKYKGTQYIPADFVERATAALYTNRQGHTYGYFWWGSKIQVDGKVMHCTTGRGAGGQLIFIIKDLDLVIVTTSHNKGMGKALQTIPSELIPAFVY